MSLRGNKRKEFSAKVKAAALKRCMAGGSKPGVPQCENCDIELNARTGIIYEHDLRRRADLGELQGSLRALRRHQDPH